MTSEQRVRRPASETKEHVLTTATDLFYWRGIRATGVDTIAEAANVTPTTLYRLFGSKDGLIAAYVDRAAERYRDRFMSWLSAAGEQPEDRIIAVFDALVQQTQPELCRGCLFQLAMAEVPDPEMPAHRAAADLKSWVRDRIGELTTSLSKQEPTAEPEVLADQLWLLMEGVYAAVPTGGGAAERARGVVHHMLLGPNRNRAA